MMDYDNFLKRFKLTNPLVIDYRQNVEGIQRPAERDVEITYTRTALQSGIFSGLTEAEAEELRIYCLNNFAHITYRVDAHFGTVVGNPVRQSTIVYPQITIEREGALYNVTVSINETDYISTASRQFYGFVCPIPITKADTRNYMIAAMRDAQITFEPFAGRHYLAYQSEGDYVQLLPKSIKWRTRQGESKPPDWASLVFSARTFGYGEDDDGGNHYFGAIGFRGDNRTYCQWRRGYYRVNIPQFYYGSINDVAWVKDDNVDAGKTCLWTGRVGEYGRYYEILITF